MSLPARPSGAAVAHTQTTLADVLFERKFIRVNPELARKIGPSKALILGQIAWLTSTAASPRCVFEIDGRRYAFKSNQEWCDDEFLWMHSESLRRTFAAMVRKGLLLKCEVAGAGRRIGYAVAGELVLSEVPADIGDDTNDEDEKYSGSERDGGSADDASGLDDGTSDTVRAICTDPPAGREQQANSQPLDSARFARTQARALHGQSARFARTGPCKARACSIEKRIQENVRIQKETAAASARSGEEPPAIDASAAAVSLAGSEDADHVDPLTDQADAVDVLIDATFDRDDARQLVTQYAVSADQVRFNVARARQMLADGTMRDPTRFRGWITAAIKRGDRPPPQPPSPIDVHAERAARLERERQAAAARQAERSTEAERVARDQAELDAARRAVEQLQPDAAAALVEHVLEQFPTDAQDFHRARFAQRGISPIVIRAMADAIAAGWRHSPAGIATEGSAA